MRMHDLGHGGLLQLIQSLPNRAQPLPLEMLDDQVDQVALSGRQLQPVSAASFFSSPAFMCSASATWSVGMPPSA